MRLVRLAAASALAAIIALPAWAQGLPRAEPDEVGFSSDRLKRLTDRMQAGVEGNELPGAIVLIARRGRVAYFETFGFRDKDAKDPMKGDAIFRIASMTKPMVSLAIMMLAEEGKLTIADPVSRFIPAFKDLKVGEEKKNADGTVEVVMRAPTREMTVQDLLRHTSGLTYGAATGHPLKKTYADLKLMDADQTNEEMVAKLAKIGLLSDPGTTWEYSMSTDVLGRIVEVVGGVPLDQFIAERITKPLGMNDTGFAVPAEKGARGARPQKEGPKNEVPNVPLVTIDAKWKSGGGGMVSTASDYARLCQMFLNGGDLDGVRLVSRKTVELMTANHLPPGTKQGPDMSAFQALLPLPEMGQGFGLGFAVRTVDGVNPLHGSAGDYFWGGAWGTYFWIDPREEMFVVAMMQSPAARLRYRFLLRELVYQALVD